MIKEPWLIHGFFIDQAAYLSIISVALWSRTVDHRQ